MKTVIDKAKSRGHSLSDWLDSYHTFSFDRYYNPQRMGFGALRVLNDDRVAPGEGFGRHPHKEMEIISIPLKGTLVHGDSMQNRRSLTPGYIQVMSAGTGVYHSEMNGSDREDVEFLQIWIIPRQFHTAPSYHDFDIRSRMQRNRLALLVSPKGDAPARMLQDVYISMGQFDAGQTLTYTLHNAQNGVYLFVIEGEVTAGDTLLSRRDGMGMYDTAGVEMTTGKESHLLLIEVPM